MGIRRNGTFWVDGALRRLSSTNGKTVIAFLPTWVKQQQKHVKVQILILFLHEKVYLKWIYFFNIKWAETSYGTRRCSPQLSGSTVKCRVRSGHFDHDFWIFTLFACRSEKWKFANSPKRREFGTTSGSGTLVWQRESRKRFCTSSCLFIEKQILVQN